VLVVRKASGEILTFLGTDLEPGERGRFSRWEFEIGLDETLNIFRVSLWGHLWHLGDYYDEVKEIERERTECFERALWASIRHVTGSDV
jgi:hypothetical protein